MTILIHSASQNPNALGWSFWIPIISSIVVVLLGAYWRYRFDKRINDLKSEVDKKLLVHRFQFEAEFATYKKIWKGLTDMQKALQFLRPEVDSHDPKSTYEETITKRAIQVAERANNLITLIDENKPFYPARINEKLNEVTKAIKIEIIHARNLRDNLKYWEEREARLTEISQTIDQACLAIRERIGTN